MILRIIAESELSALSFAYLVAPIISQMSDTQTKALLLYDMIPDSPLPFWVVSSELFQPWQYNGASRRLRVLHDIRGLAPDF